MDELALPFSQLFYIIAYNDVGLPHVWSQSQEVEYLHHRPSHSRGQHRHSNSPKLRNLYREGKVETADELRRTSGTKCKHHINEPKDLNVPGAPAFHGW